MTTSDLRETLRSNLRETWKKVPASMASASVQDVRMYKKHFATMQKLLGKSNATISELTGAMNRTNTIYK
jgi:hypothetical protein